MLEAISETWIDLVATHSVGLALLVGLALVVDRVGAFGSRGRYWLWLVCLVKAVIPPFYVLGESTVLASAPGSGFVVIESVATVGSIGSDVADTFGGHLLFVGWALASLMVGAGLIGRYLGMSLRVKQAESVTLPPTTVFDLPVVGLNVKGPFLFGLIRPTLVLPLNWRTWDDAFLQAVLIHEQTHHRSRDLWVLLVEQVAACLLWFHPCVWLIRRKLHLIREHRSDEAVVSQGLISRTHYAERLVDLMEGLRDRPMPSVGLTSGTLGKRIFHLLSREEFAVDIKRHQYLLLFGFALLLVPLSARGVDTSVGAVGEAPTSDARVDGAIEFFQIAPDERPVILKHVPPTYPDAALDDLLQGKVYVRFRVGADGRVDSAVVIKGAEVFHEAALASIRQFEFKPGTEKGEPVPVWMAQAIKFSTDQRKPQRPEYLMQLYLRPDGQLLLEDRGTVSVEEAVSALRERMRVRRSEFQKAGAWKVPQPLVSVLAGQDLSDQTLQSLVEGIRAERADVVVTLR